MGMIVLGALALVVTLAFAQLFAGADPARLVKALRVAGVVLLSLAALGAFALDRAGVGVLLASIAWSLYATGQLPDLHGLGGTRPPPPAPPTSGMSRAEAYAVLGLKAGASAEDVRAAHRKLIQQNHPDRGGSDYLAAKINQAKDVLLG